MPAAQPAPHGARRHHPSNSLAKRLWHVLGMRPRARASAPAHATLQYPAQPPRRGEQEEVGSARRTAANSTVHIALLAPLPPKLRHKFAPGPPQFSINCLTPSPLFRTSCCYTSRHHSCFVSSPSAFVRCPRFSRTRPPHSATTHARPTRVKMTPVGFEPTPFRTGALSQRLRPLGQSVLRFEAWSASACGKTASRLERCSALLSLHRGALRVSQS